MNISEIKDPKFLKDLNEKQLEELARDLREFLLQSVSKTGGHLSSNLGIVEITIALHYVFDAPKDKILFDVGHQSYIHKMLTGRASMMNTLRQYNGIAGFQKRYESEYDCFEAGHSSTSLSTALGMAVARDLNNDDYSIVPVIGDGAIMSGLALEALNQIGFEQRPMVIVFNDNNMSINKNVGALTKDFANLRNAKSYNNLKDEVKGFLKDKKYGDAVYNAIHNFKKSIKKSVIDSGIFKDLEIEYIGPIDGHNIHDLIRAFTVAKSKKMPCVVHCVTKKGKGYKFTENDINGNWHGVGKFDVQTGKPLNTNPDGYKSYSSLICETIDRMMEQNKDIVTITPAMITGSCLNSVFAKYPGRCFDCGIAEDHAVTFASGLALNGKRPFVSIYSSFLQRAYDQLNQELSRMDLPVVIGIDRAGLVGNDGETHHGVFDISYIRPLPNAVLAQGKNSEEIQDLLFTGFNQEHPFFVRYPRGTIKVTNHEQFHIIKVGSWELFNNTDNESCTIFTYGNDVEIIEDNIKNNNLNYNLVNCRFIKPIDEELLIKIAKRNKPIFIYTTDIIKGGLYDEIIECLNKHGINIPCYVLGIDDKFVTHGNTIQLKEALNIDIKSLFQFIEGKLNA